MKLPSFTIVALLLAASALPIEWCGGGEWFYSHRQRTRTKTKLPKHQYGQTVWPFTTPSTFGATAIAVAATSPTQNELGVKPFHFRATDLTVNHLNLDQVGLTLYKSGKMFASGRIYHTGGAGELIGNNVTVRVRAYVSLTAAQAPLIPEPVAVETTVADATVADATGAETPAKENAEGAAETVESETIGQLEQLATIAETLKPTTPTTPAGAVRALAALQSFRDRLKKSVAADQEEPADENEIPIATPNEVNRIPPDAYRVWSSEHSFWVSRGRPMHVSLIDPVQRPKDLAVLQQHFNEITHLEVELEYQRDR